ncbi:MAG: hypothetical protein LBV79_10280 [Candidatus Adiutrix sp.]|jgi:hypothetical protein|nr:hypothetical protein [Candidatus Adiutrix sp.]
MARNRSSSAPQTAPLTPAETAPQTAPVSADMVTVAYNSPQGMLFTVNGKEILINGNASGLRGKEKGIIPIGRYGYTRIAAADWAAIERVYGSMAIIKNGLMFSEKSKDRAEDRAEERAETRHGREAVDPESTATTEAEGVE